MRKKSSGKNRNGRKGNNRGTSMVTVVVSFALLLLFVTSYFKVQKLAGNMMMSSRDMVMNNSRLIKAYYLGETRNTTVADSVRLSFQGEDGGFFVEATLKQAKQDGLEGSIYYFSEDDKEQELR